jgi:hypothetical protein
MQAPATHTGNERHFFWLDPVDSSAVLVYSGAELHGHMIEREWKVFSVPAHDDFLSHPWPNHKQQSDMMLRSTRFMILIVAFCAEECTVVFFSGNCGGTFGAKFHGDMWVKPAVLLT